MPQPPERKSQEPSLFELVSAGVIVYASDGRVLEANERAVKSLGLSQEQMVGKPIGDPVWSFVREDETPLSPDDHPVSRVLATRGPIQDVVVGVDRPTSGDRVWTLASALPEFNDGGDLERVVATFADITEEKKAEAELGLQKAMLDETGRVAKVGGWWIDALAGKGFWTDEAARIYDVDPGLSVSRDLGMQFCTDASRPKIEAAVNEAVERGVPYDLELEIVSAKGVRKWIHTVGHPVIEAGRVVRVVGSLQDITERKRAEAAQRDSEERLRTILGGAPDGIYIQREGRFQYVNPAMAELLGGAKPEDLLGKDLLDRVAPECQDTVRGCMRAANETKVPAQPVDVEYVRLDGSRVAVQISTVAFPNHGQGAQVVFVRGRTDSKKADLERATLQAQLLQAQKMESVGKLAGGVAHDFNNILMVQKGYCEMLRLKLPKGDPVADGLAQIEAYAERATELTQELLAFSRQQPLDPVVIDLNYLMEDLEHILRRLIGEDVELVTILAPHPAPVKADRSQIEQVLVNLASNAHEAMPQGGKLTVELSWAEVEEAGAGSDQDVAPGPYIVLSVSDTGRGMDQETARRIFEPFFTAEGATQGSGLGLSAVHGVVRQAGGGIRVRSELGKGTTFEVYLPRVEVSTEELAQPPASEAMGEGELVLVVEDEPALRGLVVMMLERLGYRVKEAADGREATRMVEDQGMKPDLLLTDVVMPEMSGSVLAERLRKYMPGLKVIFMSGYADGTILDHGVSDPDVDFLRKPFSVAELEALMKSVLGSFKQ
jgi:two-component system cell cycle sensor histidine kinase/response regulator CckA